MDVAFTMPIVIGTSIFPGEILGLLGFSYKSSCPVLEIVMLSSLLLVSMATVNNLCYAYKKYKYVLLTRLAASIPRLVLYLLLTPIWASTSTALSFAIGSVTGVFATLMIVPRIGLNLDWKKLIKIFFVPC